MTRRPCLLLALWLLALTAYRLWVLPRLGIDLYVDEAQYWTWAQALDWGYYSKPPVIAWLIAASTALFGDGQLAIKLPAILLYPITAAILFALARRLFDERVALIAALAFSLMPLVSALGLFVSTDAPLLACWALALLAFWRALDTNQWRHWLLLGAACGLGLMSKYTMAAFAASALLFLLLDAQRRAQCLNPRLWLAVLLATAIFAPNLWWNWQNDFPTLRHTADITHVAHNEKTGNPGEFLLAQLVSLGPLFGLAFVVALATAWRIRHDKAIQYLLSFTLPLLLITTAQSLRAEANGNWAAPALIGACLLGAQWLCTHRKLLWLTLASNALLMVVVYHLQDFRSEGLPPKWDPLNRARGWSALAAEVRPLLAAHPEAFLLVDDRAYAAHLLYLLRDMRPQLATWNRDAQKRILDHYQLTRPIGAQHAGKPAILISKWPAGDVLTHFETGVTIRQLSIPIAQNRSLNAEIGVLENYRP